MEAKEEPNASMSDGSRAARSSRRSLATSPLLLMLMFGGGGAGLAAAVGVRSWAIALPIVFAAVVPVIAQRRELARLADARYVEEPKRHPTAMRLVVPIALGCLSLGLVAWALVTAKSGGEGSSADGGWWIACSFLPLAVGAWYCARQWFATGTWLRVVCLGLAGWFPGLTANLACSSIDRAACQAQAEGSLSGVLAPIAARLESIAAAIGVVSSKADQIIAQNREILGMLDAAIGQRRRAAQSPEPASAVFVATASGVSGNHNGSAELRKAVEAGSKSNDPLTRAKAALARGDSDVARKILTTHATSIDDKYAWHTALGDAWFMGGSFSLAAGEYERAMNMPGKELVYEARMNYANSLLRLATPDMQYQFGLVTRLGSADARRTEQRDETLAKATLIYGETLTIAGLTREQELSVLINRADASRFQSATTEQERAIRDLTAIIEGSAADASQKAHALVLRAVCVIELRRGQPDAVERATADCELAASMVQASSDVRASAMAVGTAIRFDNAETQVTREAVAILDRALALPNVRPVLRVEIVCLRAMASNQLGFVGDEKALVAELEQAQRVAGISAKQREMLVDAIADIRARAEYVGTWTLDESETTREIQRGVDRANANKNPAGAERLRQAASKLTAACAAGRLDLDLNEDGTANWTDPAHRQSGASNWRWVGLRGSVNVFVSRADRISGGSFIRVLSGSKRGDMLVVCDDPAGCPIMLFLRRR